jgi:hypothetical protein
MKKYICIIYISFPIISETTRRRRQNYDARSLDRAVQLVKAKIMSSYKAADMFGVPRSTILYRLKLNMENTKY